MLNNENINRNLKGFDNFSLYTIQGKLLWSGKKDRAGLDGAISDLFSNNSLCMMVLRENSI